MKEEKLPMLFAITVVLVALVASTASFAAVIPNSIPAYVTRAQNLGPESPSKIIEDQRAPGLTRSCGRPTRC